jgi:hypothetical protein
MDILYLYTIGKRIEYLRQCSPNVWREAEIIDVSYKNGITVKTDTGHISTHPTDHVRFIRPIIGITVTTPASWAGAGTGA